MHGSGNHLRPTWFRRIRPLSGDQSGGTTAEYALLLAVLIALALLALQAMGLSLGHAFGQARDGLGAYLGPGTVWTPDVTGH